MTRFILFAALFLSTSVLDTWVRMLAHVLDNLDLHIASMPYEAFGACVAWSFILTRLRLKCSLKRL
jgi:hypothetical protein